MKILGYMTAAFSIIGSVWAASTMLVSSAELDDMKQDIESRLNKKADAPYLMQQQIIQLESDIADAEEEIRVIMTVPAEDRTAIDNWKLQKLPSKIKSHERKLDRWYNE